MININVNPEIPLPLQTVTFPSRRVPRATSLQIPNNASGRDLTVVIPGAGMMAQSELEELCQKLREKLHRDDITPEFVMNVMENAAVTGKRQNQRVTIKPYVQQKMREREARKELEPTVHAVGNTPLYIARR